MVLNSISKEWVEEVIKRVEDDKEKGLKSSIVDKVEYAKCKSLINQHNEGKTTLSYSGKHYRFSKWI